ncbi:MAG: rod shape-determining protein MreC [Coriobacteriales bacterium]|nr:rod shape-determining protein MreC [Coriobacteriales bacterium]
MALPKQTPKRITGGVLAIVLSFVSLSLITLWSYEGGTGAEANGFLHSARSALATVVMPFDRASSLLGEPVDALGTALGDATASETSLSELQARNDELSGMVMRLEEYRLENERLTELLELSDAYSLESTAAHILKKPIDSWNQTITIDKGTQDGLAVGMPVMSPNGLIGQIESVGSFTSQVRLLTDPNSGVAVFLQANRSEGVLTGSIERLLYLNYLSLDVDVVPGDVVVTSGAGGVYPKGIVIGEITSVSSSPSDVYQTVVVKPTARVKYYEEVLVLIGRQSEVTPSAAATATSSATEGTTDSDSSDSNASATDESASSSSSAQSGGAEADTGGGR